MSVHNELSSAICDMEDIKKMLSWEHKHILELPKDNEGTETTIGDCIDDVLHFLNNLELEETK